MHFDLVDRVVELSGERVVTLKSVSAAEEYLQDHFPTFPVLPGVFMIEAMAQAARKWMESELGAGERYVLCRVRALKYGMFVRPGETMRITVDVKKRQEDGSVDFSGSAEIVRIGEAGPGPTSVSGKFTLRPVMLSGASG